MKDRINPMVADIILSKLESGAPLEPRDRQEAAEIIQWAKDAHLRMSEALHEACANGDDLTAVSIIQQFMEDGE